MAIGGNHPVDEFPLKDPLSSDLAEYVSRNPGAHVIAISTSLERDRFELSDDQAHCVEFTGHLVGEGQCDLGGGCGQCGTGLGVSRDELRMCNGWGRDEEQKVDLDRYVPAGKAERQ